MVSVRSASAASMRAICSSRGAVEHRGAADEAFHQLGGATVDDLVEHADAFGEADRHAVRPVVEQVGDLAAGGEDGLGDAFATGVDGAGSISAPMVDRRSENRLPLSASSVSTDSVAPSMMPRIDVVRSSIMTGDFLAGLAAMRSARSYAVDC